MSLSNLFTWPYQGQKVLALRDYQNDEQAFTVVKQFFMAIDGTAPILLIISLLVSIGVCTFYHFPFNNKAGRHYRPIYQLCFLLVSSLLTLMLSWILEKIMVPLPPLNSNFGVFLFYVSVGAMFFSIFIYLISALIIGISGRSNAYPLHKVFKKR